MGLVLGQGSPPRYRLLATAFVVMGSLFSSTAFSPQRHYHCAKSRHSLGLLVYLFHRRVDFLLAAQDRPERPLSANRSAPRIWQPGCLRPFSPHRLLPAQLAGYHRQHRQPVARALTAFLFTFAIWAAAAYALRRVWQQTRSQVDGVMALIAVWLAIGTISMHGFDLWLPAGWWLYHLLLLMGAITAVAVPHPLLRTAAPLSPHILLVGDWPHRHCRADALGLPPGGRSCAAGHQQRSGRILMGTGISAPIARLTQMVIHARITGLWVAGLAMGTLFAALLVIVNRADGLIVRRTDELAQANAELRAAEALRDDLTDMIAPICTPLTTSTSAWIC
ncbi:MAG: hypothetical protein IPJ90_05735 [Anaerolineaceae bacterium]|nr:hypothetical protein [Anaerolineaceae bacterium]